MILKNRPEAAEEEDTGGGGGAATAFHGRPISGRPSPPPPAWLRDLPTRARSHARSSGFKVRFSTDAFLEYIAKLSEKVGSISFLTDVDKVIRKSIPACTDQSRPVGGAGYHHRAGHQSLPMTLAPPHPPPMTPTPAQTASALANARAHTTSGDVAFGAQNESVGNFQQVR